jgi:hypothetical protein
MLTHLVSKRAYRCIISGKVFPFRNAREKKAAFAALQEHTSDLIIELDGPNASGIRRPILWYSEQYNRRSGTEAAKSDVAVSVSAA